ncbi:hypothetical protein HNY73_002561 [Argiope bruennichi]|uniref:Uncharacterized protein n=1 Tax=Argiope bruennichi TaxID=94029 RepID=A0A8T0FU20_ARGBR|nr:hypothetical protein HNY73_002561 [Argiope bruennichi]
MDAINVRKLACSCFGYGSNRLRFQSALDVLPHSRDIIMAFLLWSLGYAPYTMVRRKTILGYDGMVSDIQNYYGLGYRGYLGGLGYYGYF